LLDYNSMNYIVFDLEWNQSPRGKEGENHKIPFEIIEIGAVKLDENLNKVDDFSVVIRPKIYRELHYKIQEITQVNMKELSRGRKFTDACDDFLKWCGDSFTFCTWGPLDTYELQRNMDYYHMPLPKSPVFYYDLQKIFSLIFEDGKSRRSLESAVDFLHLPIDVDFHRADDDAYYTSLIMQKMNIADIKKYYSVDYYQVPRKREDELTLQFDTYSKFVSMSFPSKGDVMDDKVVTSTVCYKCNKRIKKKIRWFSDNSRIYYCLAICPEHGFLKGKIRMKKTNDDSYFAVKTIKLTNDEGATAIKKRQLDIRKKRQDNRKSEF